MSGSTELNEAQAEAVSYRGGPMLVIAGAGSGKTRVVTQRIAALIQEGVPAERILAVTFTNKAAGEMRERVESSTQARVFVTTFHSLGARVLRESGHYLGLPSHFTIYDEEDSEKLLKEVLKEHEQTESKQVKTLRRLISQAKNEMKGPDDVKEVLGQGAVVWQFPTVYRQYEQRLRAYGGVDFDDLLYLTVRLFKEHPAVLAAYQRRWKHILVDEYQDTNAAQYLIVRLLSQQERQLCVVGDPDQSIYSWRGADIHNILRFEEDFPGARIVRLEENYRSSQTILEASNALISHNTQRYEKHLFSAQGEGEPIHVFEGNDDVAEGAFVVSELLRLRRIHSIPLRDMALFYRTNAQSRHFEDMLLSEGIPYVVVGGVSFYQRREVKDILAYLRMVQSGADFISFIRTINLPKRGIGPTTVDRLRRLCDAQSADVLELCQGLLDPDHPLSTELRLNKKQKQGLMHYMSLIHELRDMVGKEAVSQLVRTVIHRTGYLDFLQADPETADDRAENLDELVHKAQEWEMNQATPSLAAFLEELSLKASLDEADSTVDRLCLMTLHNSKGLEFDVVFLTGLEDDMLPHVNSRSSPEKLEEERRLCYVGMTRARERLYLTHVSRRYVRGESRWMRPSLFLSEIPSDCLIGDVPAGFTESSSGVNTGGDLHYELDPEYLEEQAAEGYAKGTIVMHQQFGIGVIQEAFEGSSGPTYRIFFQNDNEVKELAARYAKLTVL
jgi:DNA helicase-2/ATP-dependent DNA helicase PcrA